MARDKSVTKVTAPGKALISKGDEDDDGKPAAAAESFFNLDNMKQFIGIISETCRHLDFKLTFLKYETNTLWHEQEQQQ